MYDTKQVILLLFTIFCTSLFSKENINTIPPINTEGYNSSISKAIKQKDICYDNYTKDQIYNKSSNYKFCKNIVIDKLSEDDHDIYHDICLSFTNAWLSDDYSSFQSILDKDVHFVLVDSVSRYGSKAFIQYLKDLKHKCLSDSIYTKMSIDNCIYWNRTAIKLEFSNNDCSTFILFNIKNRKIVNVVFYPNPLYKENKIEYYDLYWPSLNKSYVDENAHLEVIPHLNHHLPCFYCNKKSHELEWYNIKLREFYKISGKISICPSCQKVIELIPIKQTLTSNINYFHGYPRYSESNEKQNLLYLRGIKNFYFGKPLEDSIYVKDIEPGLLVFREDICMNDDNDDIDNYVISLKDCITNFNSLFFNDLSQEDYNILKDCYKRALDDGIYEAANNLAILAFNHENDYTKAVEYLRIGIEHGCTNAMINYFSILWGNDHNYSEAVNFLCDICSSNYTSAMCLWNLGVLYYCGNSIVHNVLSQDKSSGEAILKRILNLNHEDKYETDLDAIKKDIQDFFSYNDDIDSLALCGINFHKQVKNFVADNNNKKIKEYHDNMVTNKSYTNNADNLLSTLKSLKLPHPYKLGYSQAKVEGLGDLSNLYVYSETDSTFNKDYLFDYIEVEKSIMGAWQAYLIGNISHILPVYWHGMFDARKYIFTKEDLLSIPLFKSRDISTFINKILPSVKFISDDTARVKCCFWNEWEGIVIETVDIKFNGNKITKDKYKRRILIPYESHIRL